MKRIQLFFTLLVISFVASAQITTKLKIEGIERNGGPIYISIFNSEPSFKAREAFLSFSLNADCETVTKDLNLPAGEYVFSIYQDTNGNKKLDSNLIGIPKEKFGFTNYDGKSAPGNFNRHRVEVNENSKAIVVTLFKI
jgi:uncharacterized protein (DUF2141 family)